MRVAIVHYWLTTMRGGEKVLEALCNAYPAADVFTHVYVPEAMPISISSHRVRTSFIQKLPFARTAYQKYLPFMPLALEQLDMRGYDLVISSESGPAKGVLTDAGTPHICYCHTPMRYAWDFYQDYLESTGPVTRFAMRPLLQYMRMWDVLSANRVDCFVANSNNVARRIRKHYRRESTVIYPPVSVSSFCPEGGDYPEPDDFYLCFGQLVPYKRVDLAIKACALLGKKLVVIGEGSEEKRLRHMGGDVVFLGRVSSGELRRYLQRCRALLFPGEEDFGIVPLEAMAAGRPVVAYGRGGALETVVDGVTGLFFTEQTPESLADALTRLEAGLDSTPASLTAHAKTFSVERFTRSFTELAARVLAEYKG